MAILMENACGCDKIRQIVKGLCRWMRKNTRDSSIFRWRVSQGEVLQPEIRYLCRLRGAIGGEVGMTRSISSSVNCVSKPELSFTPSVSAHVCDELSVRWDESVSCDDADTSQVGTEFPTVHEGNRPASGRSGVLRDEAAQAQDRTTLEVAERLCVTEKQME